MEVQELLENARDTITVKRVYGEPYEQNGMTIIPAAAVRGGAGAGGGEDEESKGGGGGFGVAARPIGAWIIKDGKAAWKPAVDVNRIVLGGQIVGLAAILTAGRVLTARSRRLPRLELPELARPELKLRLRRRNARRTRFARVWK